MSASVLKDSSAVSRVDRVFFKLESLLNLAAGCVIVALVALATTNILGRWLFSTPISGYIDWVEQAMAFIAFLGIAYTQRMGGHIRMDILVSRFRGRWLWFTEMLSSVLMLLVTLLLIYGSYLHFWRAYSIGDSSVDINLPTWPAKLVVPFALSVLALRLIIQIWAYLRAMKRADIEPVAVPMIESAAETAAKEAETVSSGTDEEASK